ncbi:putative E3 ubiquitin-protein ligase RF4 [Morella rubra]|uniref:Putative E3 ubiquitin-protein ligase RF4 n=1 Tax=Morella rubra TaxID=262757 RepID=A0A6A1WRX7_9ROSI|nr:putative E3 ubiquitin-protein ligase RF4 [Morella rubra]
MQAVHRHSENRSELKTLKLEKKEADQVESQKEKQILGENTMKRLFEMENALSKATERLDIANATLSNLGFEHLMLTKKLKMARTKALESAARYREILEREQVNLEKVQSCERGNAVLQEELEKEKKEGAELRQKVYIAQILLNQVKIPTFQADVDGHALEGWSQQLQAFLSGSFRAPLAWRILWEGARGDHQAGGVASAPAVPVVFRLLLRHFLSWTFPFVLVRIVFRSSRILVRRPSFSAVLLTGL